MTMDEGHVESGYINCRPCIAEFMTTVPSINEAGDISSIKCSSMGMQSYCQNFNLASHPTAGLTSQENQGIMGADPDPRDLSLVNNLGVGIGHKYPDFAWMKDKKMVRKSTNVGTPTQSTDIGINYINIYKCFLYLHMDMRY